VGAGFQSKELIVRGGLNLGDVDQVTFLLSLYSGDCYPVISNCGLQFPVIDVTIDGADEVASVGYSLGEGDIH
jgi:hypothetical protein